MKGVKCLSKREAAKLFDKTAQFYLGISGKEFLRRWDEGDYKNIPDFGPEFRVAGLIPLVREEKI